MRCLTVAEDLPQGVAEALVSDATFGELERHGLITVARPRSTPYASDTPCMAKCCST